MGQCEPQVFESDGWEVDLALRELRARGVPVTIGSRAFEIIELLVMSAGKLVTKDDLMKKVWPGAIVEENTIQVHISAIRRALGSDRGMLKTFSGRGYRLLGSWAIREDAPTRPDAPKPRSEGVHPFSSNVPIAASALVGRETIVQHLCNLVSAYRVVTLTGPGGIGKTVLSAAVTRRIFPTLEGDAWFVELASLSDPELVPSAVASTLRLQLSGGEIRPGLVADAIGNRKVLLVLDNCEHVVDAAANFVDILVRACPRCTVLSTSREILRVEGECVYRVPPLEVPAEDDEDSASILSRSAVELFVTRAKDLDFGPLAAYGQSSGDFLDLPPPRRHTPRDRVGRGARCRARRSTGGRRLVGSLRAAHRRTPHRPAKASDASRRAELELRATAGTRTAAAASPLDLSCGIYARCRCRHHERRT